MRSNPKLSRACAALISAVVFTSCGGTTGGSGAADEPMTVAATPTRAQTADGRYISWKEHLIDTEAIGGLPVYGSDGLSMGDLDLDGHPDIVSVHESDTTYDGVPDGHIRVAFGTEDPDRWILATLAEGREAGAAEDVAIGDMNGDGFPDVVAACELAHLIYFQNPGKDARHAKWERVIPPVTLNRGSFIRVFLADLNQDGRPEVVAANKGGQNPDPTKVTKGPISWFEVPADPLDGEDWLERELGRVVVPINSQPVDLDGDGDIDVVGGSRGEVRILWFENLGGQEPGFKERTIRIEGTARPAGAPRFEAMNGFDDPLITGITLDFADLNGDGRPDIVVNEWLSYVVWLEQPADPSEAWELHSIGGVAPDKLVSVTVADINGDGRPDVMTGAYSNGPRDRDGEDMTPDDSLGRIAWFGNSGASSAWSRHDISRRMRGMYDKFAARDLDGDGDLDFVSTRGNSAPFDGVFWLEQVRTDLPAPAFEPALETESRHMPLPSADR